MKKWSWLFAKCYQCNHVTNMSDLQILGTKILLIQTEWIQWFVWTRNTQDFYAKKSTWWRKLSCDEIKTYHVNVKQNKIKKQWNANIIRSSLQFLSFVKSSFNLLMSYVFVNEIHYLRCYYQWNYMGIN